MQVSALQKRIDEPLPSISTENITQTSLMINDENIAKVSTLECDVKKKGDLDSFNEMSINLRPDSIL